MHGLISWWRASWVVSGELPRRVAWVDALGLTQALVQGVAVPVVVWWATLVSIWTTYLGQTWRRNWRKGGRGRRREGVTHCPCSPALGRYARQCPSDCFWFGRRQFWPHSTRRCSDCFADPIRSKQLTRRWSLLGAPRRPGGRLFLWPTAAAAIGSLRPWFASHFCV